MKKYSGEDYNQLYGQLCEKYEDREWFFDDIKEEIRDCHVVYMDYGTKSGTHDPKLVFEFGVYEDYLWDILEAMTGTQSD